MRSTSTFFARLVRFGTTALTIAVGALAACSGKGASPSFDANAADATTDSDQQDAYDPQDGAAEAAAPNTDIGKCVSTFGHGLTDSFGRIDGQLVAIVRPQDQHCALPNSDHVVLEIQSMGAVYRMVVNVKSDKGTDLRVRFRELGAPLPAPAFADGWHTGLSLDYVALGAHSNSDFVPMDMQPLVTRVVGDLRIGMPVSVYATSGNGITDSAHLVHRVNGSTDGAIVVDPTSTSPTFLLFHFAEQAF